ncbi:MAG TPA: beta/gamma crystallin-related protein [Candidatus Bathyarchaeia archaeon]
MVSGRPIMGECIIFHNANMRGGHRHIFNEEPDLRHPEDPGFNDAVSSFVIVKGVWKLYRDANYANAYDGEYGPGVYERTDRYGVKNDEMSSLKCIRP